MLQRRLRIGYNRAARIMEIMEEKGIVGPENGSSPREILGDLDALVRARAIPDKSFFPCPGKPATDRPCRPSENA